MPALGKTTKGLRKHPTVGDMFTIPKTLLFAHKFASDSSTLDLSALVVPSDIEFTTWVNPSAAELANARIMNKKAKVYLQYMSRPARLLPTVSYDIASDAVINLKNGSEALAGEVIVGWVETASTGNVQAIDGYTIVKTGVLTIGQTDVTTSLPFNYNKYSDQQVGDVIFFLDGQQLFRCASNNPANDGEYTELAPTAGNLSNTLRLKDPVTETVSYLVVSNGSIAFAPNETMMDYVRTLAGQIDILVADMAGVTGNPPSRYQSAPNQTDLSVFGQRVYSFTSETFYNCVVGSAAQVLAGKATHTGTQAAHDACPVGGKVLLLEGTFSGALTFNKKIKMEGKGNSSVIDGVVTLATSYAMLNSLRFGDNLTIGVGANGNFIRECWIASGKIVTDNGTANAKLLIEEA